MTSLALKADGTVVGWGNNDEGQSTIPAGMSNVVAVAVGYQYSMALMTNGNVAIWGAPLGVTATNIPPDLTNNVVAIAAGGTMVWRSRPTGRLWPGATMPLAGPTCRRV